MILWFLNFRKNLWKKNKNSLKPHITPHGKLTITQEDEGYFSTPGEVENNSTWGLYKTLQWNKFFLMKMTFILILIEILLIKL